MENEDQNYFIKVSGKHYVSLRLSPPPQSDEKWFTDAHFQEILTAIASNFKEMYNSDKKLIVRTPRTSFSIYSTPRTFKQYSFVPDKQNGTFQARTNLPRMFFARVLGRADVADRIYGMAPLDSAIRIIR